MFLSKYSFYTTQDRRRRSKLSNRKNSLINDELNNKSITNRQTIFKTEYLLYLLPNFNQIQLVFGCLLSLCGLIALFYHLYGYKFLYETYIYHFLVRQDTRHNFSLYFYLQYLTAAVKNIGLWQKVLIALPQLILIVVFSFRYGLNRFALNFTVLVQTIVMVAYNTVLTSQYFVWIVVVLPLCLWQIRISVRNAAFLVGIWLAAQCAWLLPAYYLEFRGQNTFMFVWIQSVSLFCAHIAILGRLIMYFMPTKDLKCKRL